MKTENKSNSIDLLKEWAIFHQSGKIIPDCGTEGEGLNCE